MHGRLSSGTPWISRITIRPPRNGLGPRPKGGECLGDSVAAVLGPRPKTCLPFRLRAASLGKVSRKKFGRQRLVPKTGLSAELLAKRGAAARQFGACPRGRQQRCTWLDLLRRRECVRRVMAVHVAAF